MLYYLDSVSRKYRPFEWQTISAVILHEPACSCSASRKVTNFNVTPVRSCSHILDNVLILKRCNSKKDLAIGKLVDIYDATTASIITDTLVIAVFDN